MKYAFPILTQDGKEFADSKALNGLLKGESGGHYLLGGHSKWHGGIHISEQTAPWCKDKHPVRCIADGKVVAFRMMPDYLSSTFQDQTLKYSNCFCLVEHAYCETNPDTKEKNEFTFYSLYMHLLPWDHHQQGDKLVLKVGRNVRNSVPHLHPTPEELLSDQQLPSLTLPAGTEFERVAGTPTKRGTLGKTDYDFVLVKVLSPGRQSQQMLAAQGDNVWLAMDEKAVATIKPQLPNWLYDQVEAELTTAMAGRADPIQGEAGELPKAGAHSVSLPAGTRIRFDAHQQEFQQNNGKSRKMARCTFEAPAPQNGAPALCGMAWVCVEDEFIKVQNKSASHLGELYVLPSPLPIAAGDTIGYLGLVETPTSLVERDAKKSIHQLHLEVFSQDPKLADVLANKAQTKGGASYAKVPAGLTLAKKSQQANAVSFTPTDTLSQEVLLDSPRPAKDNAGIDWIEVMTGLFVQQSKVEMLSQHDWLKIGFQSVDGSGSDGHLAPETPSAFFLKLAKAIDPKREGELTSADVHKILQDKAKAETIQKLIVKHPSEWYEKSASPSYQWLDKLMAEVGLPEFDKLVDHEKQRIDSLEWMQSAAKLKLGPDLWHFYPLAFSYMDTLKHPRHKYLNKVLELEFLPFKMAGGINEDDYINAANELGCETAAIKAVAETETGNAGSYYTSSEGDYIPSILFERHYFSRLTSGIFDKSNPKVSNASAGGYGVYSVQYEKLIEAYNLDQSAALKSASWGRFQIMGNNYSTAGYPSVEDFVKAMGHSESNHLKAFVSFIKSNSRLLKSIRTKDWYTFAINYNGPKQNGYDIKMRESYEKNK